MSRNTCIVSTGSICSSLAFVLSSIALFLPYWYTIESAASKLNRGIVLTCIDTKVSDRDCDWTLDDTWEGAKDVDDFGKNWLTVQVLWILGCSCFLLNSILSFLLCCDSCKGPVCSVILTVLVFIAAACLTIAVIIFGADNGDQWDRDTNLLGYAAYYDWGYYVAIAASITSVIAVFAMGFIICCTRND